MRLLAQARGAGEESFDCRRGSIPTSIEEVNNYLLMGVKGHLPFIR
jgi:hypothetical protein